MGGVLKFFVVLAGTTYGCAAELAPVDIDAADAGQMADAMVGYRGLTCTQLVQEVFKLPRDCDEKTTCSLIGNSCTPSRLFFSVNSSGWTRGVELHDVMRETGCNLGYDGYIPRAECVSGRCELMDTPRACMPSLNPDWDAGDRGQPAIDAAATDAAAAVDGETTAARDSSASAEAAISASAATLPP
jgi:hypothetical protein